jgi:hypothetical protein
VFGHFFEHVLKVSILLVREFLEFYAVLIILSKVGNGSILANKEYPVCQELRFFFNRSRDDNSSLPLSTVSFEHFPEYFLEIRIQA